MRRSCPQVRIDAALDDPKEGLIVARFGGETALGPAVRPLHGSLAVCMVIGVGAFVESHDDIRAQVFLDLDGFFGSKTVGGAVNVALEGDAIVVNFTGLGQGEHLVTARIGQHGMRPLHEVVQAAQFCH